MIDEHRLRRLFEGFFDSLDDETHEELLGDHGDYEAVQCINKMLVDAHLKELPIGRMLTLLTGIVLPSKWKEKQDKGDWPELRLRCKWCKDADELRVKLTMAGWRVIANPCADNYRLACALIGRPDGFVQDCDLKIQ